MTLLLGCSSIYQLTNLPNYQLVLGQRPKAKGQLLSYKIYVSLMHIHADQLCAYFVAHIQALLAVR